MLHLHCATNLSHHPTIAFLLVESRFQMLSAAMHVGDLVQTESTEWRGVTLKTKQKLACAQTLAQMATGVAGK
jgi:UDP-N-acetyl-D-mannosaminuronate dehydrogenase